jgi:hypothetical protein
MGYRTRSVSHAVSFRKLLRYFAPQFVASRLCEREKELTAEAARLGLNSHRARHFAGSAAAVALPSMQKAMPSQLLFPKLPCPASPCRKDTPLTPIRKRFVTPNIPGWMGDELGLSFGFVNTKTSPIRGKIQVPAGNNRPAGASYDRLRNEPALRCQFVNTKRLR